MKQRRSKPILSIFLALLLMIGIIPDVFSFNTSYGFSEPTIIEEATDMRTETSKQFRRSDGSYTVAVYPFPVHCREGERWIDVDMKLSNDQQKGITADYGYYSATCPNSIGGENDFSLMYNNRTISFSLSNAKLRNSTAKLISPETMRTSIEPNADADELSVQTESQGVFYKDVLPYVDFEYLLTSNSLKESIIIKETSQAYDFSFNFDLGDLTPVTQLDGSILLIDRQKDDKPVFIIEAPFMYDSAGEKSDNVSVNLQKNNRNYILNIVADSDWVNSTERSFPVIIDPTIILASSSIDDIMVINGVYANQARRINELRTGRNLTNITRTYIKFALPTNIPSGSVIANAKLTLQKASYYQAPSQSNISIRAYDCNHVSNISFNDITWNYQPFSNTNGGYYNTTATFLSAVTATSSRSEYEFDITPAVVRWYDEPNATNRYLALVSSNEASKTQVDYHSTRVNNSDNRPVLTFDYSGEVTISYDGNYNTSGNAPVTSVVNTPGNAVISQLPSGFERAHFTFGGWRITGESTSLPANKSIGDVLSPGESISWATMSPGQLALKAVWLYPTDIDDLFCQNSVTYNHNLATLSMYLSSVAYNPLPSNLLFNIPASMMTDFTPIEDVLIDHGFVDIEQKNYPTEANPSVTTFNTAGQTFAHKNITLSNGVHKTLVLIVIRGTAPLQEWITDIISESYSENFGFPAARLEARSNFESYMDSYGEDMLQEKITLVTGHSLGGAVANLLAADLNKSPAWGSSRVYCYTFASPKTTRSNVDNYTNIFNIINRNDVFPLVPFNSLLINNPSSRYGIDIPVLMPIEAHHLRKVSLNHKMDTYLNWMYSLPPTSTFSDIMAISAANVSTGLLPRIISLKCPVEVRIYDEDNNLIAFESEEENVIYPTITDTDIASWISEEGEKTFFLPYGSSANELQVEAYDDGVMSIAIASIDVADDDPVDSIVLNNIILYQGKEFAADISQDIAVEDTQLFIMDNGVIVGEVSDPDPLLLSVSVSNPVVSYGTASVITVVTDDSVTKVQFINSVSEATLTYDQNTSGVVSVVQDGDTLIWTIQRVFTVGDLFYHARVKVGNTWYNRIDRVMHLTITS